MESVIPSDNPPFSIPIQKPGEASAAAATDLAEPLVAQSIAGHAVCCHGAGNSPLQSIAEGAVREHGAGDTSPQSIAELEVADQRAAGYLRASLSDSTKRAYGGDLAHYIAWGGTIPAGPELVARYLAHHGERLSPFTLARRLVAIGKAHEAGGSPNPCDSELARATLRGIRRVHGMAQRRVDPMLREDLVAVMDALPPTLKGARDRALMLVGFSGAFRRSELVSLRADDVRFVPEGMTVRLRRSKTDQSGEGRDIGIPFARSRACPVKALRDWLDRGAITCGPIFRGVSKGGRVHASALTSQSVALIVKHYAASVGLDPARVSGHSLRAGLITSAAKLGVSTYKIRQQSGHASDAMLARYIRDADIFNGNAAGAVL